MSEPQYSNYPRATADISLKKFDAIVQGYHWINRFIFLNSAILCLLFLLVHFFDADSSKFELFSSFLCLMIAMLALISLPVYVFAVAKWLTANDKLEVKNIIIPALAVCIPLGPSIVIGVYYLQLLKIFKRLGLRYSLKSINGFHTADIRNLRKSLH